MKAEKCWERMYQIKSNTQKTGTQISIEITPCRLNCENTDAEWTYQRGPAARPGVRIFRLLVIN